MKVCSAYGAGFFFIPGTDTCLRLSVRARFEYAYQPSYSRSGTAAATPGDYSGYQGRLRINLDARTQTSYGTLRAFLRTSWSTPQFGPDRTPYQSSTYMNYFDCDGRKIAYTGNTYYLTPEPEGKPVHQEPEHPVDRLKFQPVKPGSAGEERLKFVCKFRSKNFMTRRAAPLAAG